MHGLIFETSVCYWQNQPGCSLSSRSSIQTRVPTLRMRSQKGTSTKYIVDLTSLSGLRGIFRLCSFQVMFWASQTLIHFEKCFQGESKGTEPGSGLHFSSQCYSFLPLLGTFPVRSRWCCTVWSSRSQGPGLQHKDLTLPIEKTAKADLLEIQRLVHLEYIRERLWRIALGTNRLWSPSDRSSLFKPWL